MKAYTDSKAKPRTVLTSLEGCVLNITLNRPEKLNALSPQLVNEMRKAVEHAKTDSQARAIVITGAGRAFCVGGDVDLDIETVGKLSHEGWGKYHRHLFRVIKSITEIEKPVIAAVNGIALGGGLELALACDITIASDEAIFGIPHTRFGLIPGWGGTYFLPRQIGMGKTKLLTFTGDTVDAKEAERIGLVDKVVAKSQFPQAVNDLAKRLATGATKAIGQTKTAINKSYQMNLEQTREYITKAMYPLLNTKDYQESLEAFKQKRQPVFTGK